MTKTKEILIENVNELEILLNQTKNVVPNRHKRAKIMELLQDQIYDLKEEIRYVEEKEKAVLSKKKVGKFEIEMPIAMELGEDFEHFYEKNTLCAIPKKSSHHRYGEFRYPKNIAP